MRPPLLGRAQERCLPLPARQIRQCVTMFGPCGPRIYPRAASPLPTLGSETTGKNLIWVLCFRHCGEERGN